MTVAQGGGNLWLFSQPLKADHTSDDEGKSSHIITTSPIITMGRYAVFSSRCAA